MRDDKIQPGVIRGGDKMSQIEFRRHYSQMGDDFRAELLGGVVYEPPPPSLSHGEEQCSLAALFWSYASRTVGVSAATDVTVILSPEDEVHPDVILRIFPEFGGNSQPTKNRGKVLKGCPELICEISYSSRAIDLHLKKERYALNGAREYLVLCTEPMQFYWFDLAGGRQLFPDEKGIYRSQVFPGLWIGAQELYDRDHLGAQNVLLEGIGSDEHRAFVTSQVSRKAT